VRLSHAGECLADGRSYHGRCLGECPDAPRIITHEPNNCTTPRCSRDEWSGENVYSGGAAQCTPTPHWEAIVKEAERVGWPRDYRRDLYVHDRAHLGQLDPSEPFVWILRENGTHLFSASYVDGVGQDAVHFATSTPQIFAPYVCRIYTWDGLRLREHKTPEHAAEAMRELQTRWLAAQPEWARRDFQKRKRARY
jgi:hypothetical protein